MMHVRIMRVAMDLRGMLMGMDMRFARRVVRPVVVLVVRVLRVGMAMRHRLMGVLVVVPLDQMQP